MEQDKQQDKQQMQTQKPERKPDETGGIHVQGHIKIFDRGAVSRLLFASLIGK